MHLNLVTDLLKELTVKLYKKNPNELKKTGLDSLETRVDAIFRCPPDRIYEVLDFKDGTEAMLLGFEPDFKGDRVFAVMYGLYTMILKSYNNNCEFFLIDVLDQQNLYNSARNIEILVWRLKTRRLSSGYLVLETNTLDGTVKNISFERLFGKLISLQDTMAVIISKRTDRLIKEVVQFAGMSFLPVGL
ncbi:MAG: hypothetical protein GY729_03435 [Desulfobacteraceae bacterium]|nr:hypothetical protein [Desulfobacteraceae bacterium]